MPSSFLMIRRPPRSTLFPSDALPISTVASSYTHSPSQHISSWSSPRNTSHQAVDRKSTRLNSSHSQISYAVFFFNDTATTEIYPLSLRRSSDLDRSFLVHALPVAAHLLLVLAQEHFAPGGRSEEHTSELQSQSNLVCRLLF